MWLPRPLYEAIPYAGIALGLGCVGTAFEVEQSPRSALFVLGTVLVTAGALLWMKRRDYRSTQADYDPRAIDE